MTNLVSGAGRPSFAMSGLWLNEVLDSRPLPLEDRKSSPLNLLPLWFCFHSVLLLRDISFIDRMRNWLWNNWNFSNLWLTNFQTKCLTDALQLRESDLPSLLIRSSTKKKEVHFGWELLEERWVKFWFSSPLNKKSVNRHSFKRLSSSLPIQFALSSNFLSLSLPTDYAHPSFSFFFPNSTSSITRLDSSTKQDHSPLRSYSSTSSTSIYASLTLSSRCRSRH